MCRLRALTHAHRIRHKLAGVQISTSMHEWICKAGLVWLDGSLATALHQPVHQSVRLSARPSVSAEMKRLPVLSAADRPNPPHFTAERQYCNTATCSAAPQQHSSGPHLLSGHFYYVVVFEIVRAEFYTASSFIQTYGDEIDLILQL